MTQDFTYKLYENTQFNDKYRLLNYLGSGQFGAVFEAQGILLDTPMGESVALKVIRGDRTNLDDIIQELELAISLNHPHIIQCQSWEEGQLYDPVVPKVEGIACAGLVMEKGDFSLREYLEQKKQLSVEETRSIIEQLASALEYLHKERSIVHQDIKPENIMKVGDDWKLTDFGVSRIVAKTSMIDYAVMGTFEYASPEVLEYSRISSGWDCWSLGVILVELLTGQRPFQSTTTEEFKKNVIHEEPTGIDTLPQPFQKIARGCLNKDPKQRWTATEIREALAPPSLEPPSNDHLVNKLPKPTRKKGFSLIFILIGLLGLGGFGVSFRVFQKTTFGVISSIACSSNLDKLELHNPAYKFPPETKQQGLIPGLSGTKSVIGSDCRHFVTYGYGNDIKVWNVGTGELIHSLSEHSDRVGAVAISSDEKTLVSGGSDGSIIVWSLETGKYKIKNSQAHSSSVNGLAISPDGETFVSGSADGTVKIWDSSLSHQTTLKGHSGSINAMVLSPDGQTIISSSDHTIKLWSFETQELKNVLIGHSGSVNTLATSSDGQMLVSGSKDSTIKVWSLETGELRDTLTEHSGSVNQLAISSDGEHLVSASSDDTFKLWDLKTGELLDSVGDSGIISLVFAPNGKSLALGTSQGLVKVGLPYLQDQRMANGPLHYINKLENNKLSVKALALRVDRNLLISSSSDQKIRLWNLDTGKLEKRKRFPLASYGASLLAISPDGRTLVTGNQNGLIRTWNLETGEEVKKIHTGYGGRLNVMVLSPDGQTLIAAGQKAPIKVWDLKTGKLKRTFNSGDVSSLVISPDGQTLVSDDGLTIRIWKLDTGELQDTINIITRNFTDSPTTGTYVFGETNIPVFGDSELSFSERNALFMRARRGELALAIAISPDGQTLVSGGIFNALQVWNLKTGQLHRLIRPSGDTNAIVISPDGKLLVSASSDNSGHTIKVWELSTGDLLNTLKGHTSPINTLVISSDGETLIYGSDDSDIRVWTKDGKVKTKNGDWIPMWGLFL